MEGALDASGGLRGFPAELAVVLLAAVLGFVHLFAAALAITKERGAKWNAGPRDEVMPPPGPLAGRLDRAFRNFLETFPIFVAAVFVAFAAGRLGGISVTGAWLYLIARALYLPIYAAGIPYVRSLAWGAALAGIVMVLAAAFGG